MKKIHKLLSVTISILMIIGVFFAVPITSYAAEDQIADTPPEESSSEGFATSDGFKGELLYDGTWEITEYSGKESNLVIPGEFFEKKVTSIGCDAFYDNDNIVSVTIPDSVTYISNQAFYDCASLKSINVDTNNTEYSSIDGVLFNKSADTILTYPNGKATSYTIPSGVTTIEYSAFGYCRDLEEVIIGNDVTTIGYNAFENCTNLSNVVMSDSVREISAFAFCGCESLTKISIPKNVNYVDYYVFNDCTALEAIEVDNSNIAYSSIDGVLYNKDGDTLIAYPNAKGTSYTIPDGVTAIEEGAFTGCVDLENISVPDSVIRVGEYAFNDTAWYNNQPDGVIYVGKVAYQYFGEMPENASVVIKDGTKAIAECAFHWCINLGEVIIPDSVELIGKYAFEGCDGLKSVEIPDSVVRIETGAFGYEYYYDDEDNVKIDGFTIYGVKGSEAERYAVDNGFEFVEIDQPEIKVILGDANGDSKVDIKDVTFIQKATANDLTLSEAERKAADTNGDGTINIKDATEIQKYIAGSGTEYKIGELI